MSFSEGQHGHVRTRSWQWRCDTGVCHTHTRIHTRAHKIGYLRISTGACLQAATVVSAADVLRDPRQYFLESTIDTLSHLILHMHTLTSPRHRHIYLIHVCICEHKWGSPFLHINALTSTGRAENRALSRSLFISASNGHNGKTHVRLLSALMFLGVDRT